MSDKTKRYWFPKWRVLCTYSEKGWYTVINGCWEFKIDKEGYPYFRDGKRVNAVKDTPIKVSRSRFDKLEPNFGYW